MFHYKLITKINYKSILITIAFIALASCLRIWPLDILGNKLVWITYYPAVMAASLYAGIIGGLFATAMTLIITIFFWNYIVEAPFIATQADWIGLFVFVFTCTMISIISEKMKQSKKEAIESQKRAQQANEAKSAFLANMSHELRTPLNAILGYSQLMQRDQTLTNENMHYLEVINKSGEHLLSLINDILEITKIESKKQVLQKEPFNIWEMVEDISNMFRLKVEAKKIEFEVIGMLDLPQFLEGDLLKLRVVLINLVNNAVKFTDRGKITLLFQVKPGEESYYQIHVEVKDTGCGIKAEDFSKLFHFFSQTDSGISSKTGTGLGLAISQEYIRLMGGMIQVESQVGEGSRFYFDINMKSVDPILQYQSNQIPFITIEPNKSLPLIMVVDDIIGNRELLVEILKKTGFPVVSAANGEEAVENYKKFQPKLIWMDIRMPIMDGFEATRLIRNIKLEPEPIIIALSAHVFQEEKEAILREGFDDYLAKPFREIDIFKRIEKFLNIPIHYQQKKNEKEVFDNTNGNDEINLSKELSKLPLERKTSFYHSLMLLDPEVIQKEIEQINTDDPILAKHIQPYLDKLEYAKLIRFLKEGSLDE